MHREDVTHGTETAEMPEARSLGGKRNTYAPMSQKQRARSRSPSTVSRRGSRDPSDLFPPVWTRTPEGVVSMGFSKLQVL